jgi:hypothetical protein
MTGRLWVTASGCQEDSVLAPGEEVTFTGRGRIVVEALRTAAMRLEIHTAARVKARALRATAERGASSFKVAHLQPIACGPRIMEPLSPTKLSCNLHLRSQKGASLGESVKE